MIQPLKHWIEDRVKEKRKRAYHYRNFKSHDEEKDYPSMSTKTLGPSSNSGFFHHAGSPLDASPPRITV
jgi:hypothetical protein